MKHIELNTTVRTITGNPVRKLRREGMIPGVVYGKVKDSINIQLNLREFVKVFKEAGQTAVIDLKVDTKKHPVLVHDLDLDPVTDIIRHVDFLAIDLKTKTVATVPVILEGESPVIKSGDGVLNQPVTELQVKALPEDFPSHIVVDVATLVNSDSTIKVSDIVLLEGNKYSIEEDPDKVIVSIGSAQVEEEIPEEIVSPGEDSTSTTSPEDSDSEAQNTESKSKE